MLHKKKGEIQWLEFELFANDPRIVHGVFLRHGGVSSENFASLNLIRDKGDLNGNVDENLKRVSDCLTIKNIVGSKQVHGKDVTVINHFIPHSLQCDVLMTNNKNLGLMAVHADCQAAILYDPVHQAIATVHAGWRGQVQNIYREAIQKMHNTFFTRPQDLLVGVSPSLGPDNSEFIHFQTELPESFWEFQIKSTYFDLWSIAQQQLEDCGVLSLNIEIARIDTFENPHDFFSYRKQRSKGLSHNITGGHGTVAALRH